MDEQPGARPEALERDQPRRRKSRSNLAVWLWITGASVAAAVILSMVFVEAPPPRRIVIASGGKDGAYYRFAHEYARQLARDGLHVGVRETAGSVENLALLGEDGSGVDVAIVQSGVANAKQLEEFESLGSLYREPLWVFYRGETPVSRLSELSGKRIGVGSPGSGTQAIARRLLDANNLRESAEADAGVGTRTGATRLVEHSVSDAADELVAGQLDAAFFVAAFEADYVQRLLREPSVHLASIAQQDAYRRRFRFLAPITIPQGAVELGANLPDHNVALLAPTAMLVVRPNFHPALVPLFLTAAQRIHGAGDVISEPQEFPSPAYCDLPVNDYATRFYTSGRPMLQKLLPFWLASLVDRAKFMLIPLVMLMMPLFRAAPPLIRWRTRHKVYRWYGMLREIDQASNAAESTTDLDRELTRLRNLENHVARVEVPAGYMKEFYHLRSHISLLNSRIQALRAARERPGRN